MAKAAGTAWGIDLGNSALKAIKIATGDDDNVEVLDYAVIEHDTILTSPEVNPQQRIELINKSLEKFVDEHDISGSHIVVGVPGHSSFARFAKLPPVDKKNLPNMVHYEAQQQIPFDINDVEWDWQVLSEDEEAQEIEIGIFAIKTDLAKRLLYPYTEINCLIDTVQMGPMALFNFLSYDKPELSSSEEAVILIDIGAENTDLIIAHKGRVWQRSIKIGGNHFTAAVQKSFKLSFQKAENIKRTANTSKHARQIFQAMRPVFSDLAAEIQRSLGFYSSGNRDTQFGEALAMGNAMKLPGLLKFLQQSLSLPIKRLDSFEKSIPADDISVAEFSGHIPRLPIAYGLALQGIGEGVIDGNLLPKETIRQTQWKRKHKWFIAACACFMIGGIIAIGNAQAGKADIANAKTAAMPISSSAAKINETNNAKNEKEEQINQIRENVQKHKIVYSDRSVVQKLHKALVQALPNAEHNPDQAAVYQAFLNGQLNQLKQTPRKERKQVFISGIKTKYTDDLSKSFEAILASNSMRGAGSGFGYGAGEMGGGTTPMTSPMTMPGQMTMPGTPMLGNPSPLGNANKSTGSTQDNEGKKPGFVVVIEGSTPNKNGLEFLNVPGVGLDRQTWGFFNRLYHFGKTDKQIKKLMEEKSFKINDAPQNDYQKNQNEYASNLMFESYIGQNELKLYFDTNEGSYVSGIGNMGQPVGIGVMKIKEDQTGSAALGMGNIGYEGAGMVMGGVGNRTNNQLPLLIDPFTQEVVSIEYKENDEGDIVLENGEPVTIKNDYWFRLKMKIALKDNNDSSDVANAESN